MGKKKRGIGREGEMMEEEREESIEPSTLENDNKFVKNNESNTIEPKKGFFKRVQPIVQFFGVIAAFIVIIFMLWSNLQTKTALNQNKHALSQTDSLIYAQKIALKQTDSSLAIAVSSLERTDSSMVLTKQMVELTSQMAFPKPDIIMSDIYIAMDRDIYNSITFLDSVYICVYISNVGNKSSSLTGFHVYVDDSNYEKLICIVKNENFPMILEPGDSKKICERLYVYKAHGKSFYPDSIYNFPFKRNSVLLMHGYKNMPKSSINLKRTLNVKVKVPHTEGKMAEYDKKIDFIEIMELKK